MDPAIVKIDPSPEGVDEGRAARERRLAHKAGPEKSDISNTSLTR